MRRVLVVAPTRRDLLNLADARVLARYDLVFEERPGVQGVFGSSDSTAALAVVVADRLGLPGPGYEAFMRCHDKLVSRRIQAEAVPEATPPVRADRRDAPARTAAAALPVLREAGAGAPVAARLRGRQRRAAGRGAGRRAAGQLPPSDRRGAAVGAPGHVRGLHARRRGDTRRRDRCRAARKRHQLPAIRVPQQAPGRAPAADGRDRLPADARARVRPVAVQHRVLRRGRRTPHDRRGERADGVAVRAAGAGRARRLHV